MTRLRLSVLVSAILIAGCSENIPCECACQPDVQKKVQIQLERSGPRAKSLEVSKRVINCKPDDAKSCVVDVPVTVDDSGQCFTRLEYCVICVRNGKTGTRTQVTWRLVDKDGKETDRFAFTRQTGIDIYFAGATGKEEFVEGGLAVPERRSQFKWVAGKDPSAQLAHGTTVYDKENNNRECLPADPVLVNSNN